MGVYNAAALSALCQWGFDSRASLELERRRVFYLKTKYAAQGCLVPGNLKVPRVFRVSDLDSFGRPQNSGLSDPTSAKPYCIQQN